VVVKLINTDGMAFIGPGSEWFWTAVTGVVLAVTFIGIYRQLSIARSASAREQLVAWDREWDTERQMRYRRDILVAIREGVERSHLPEGSAMGVATWWAQIAQLDRNGHVDRKALYSRYGRLCQLWWAILTPHVRRARAESGVSQMYGDFEWLAGQMAETDRRAGMPMVDETALGPLSGAIARLEDQIRIEAALRTVIITSPDAPTVRQPTAPAAAQVAAQAVAQD
jgi:hypothetical protein